MRGREAEPGVITGKSNRRVSEIRRLRQRKEREASGLLLVEGVRAVGAAAESGGVETLVVAPELLTSDFGLKLVRSAEEKGTACLWVSGDVFRSLSAKDNPQGLAAVARQRWNRLPDLSPEAGRRWVALDSVQDPGNLGTILRTSDASGCSGAVLTGQTTDPYDPGAVRASTGAVFSQTLVRASFHELSAWAGSQGVALVGTSGEAEADYRDFVYPSPVVIVMGSEREGLSEEQRAACDATVSIPMVGRVDSLNLAVAAGLVLYEVFQQSGYRGHHPTDAI